MSEPGIDPNDLQTCLRVFEQLNDLPVEHPDSIAIQRATAGLFKTVRKRRRTQRRQEVLSNDNAVIAATATGSPDRIDDETQGLPIVSKTHGASAGTLIRPQACYICKERYTVVDAFYHQMCPTCAAKNRSRRDASVDLSGRRALEIAASIFRGTDGKSFTRERGMFLGTLATASGKFLDEILLLSFVAPHSHTGSR